MNVFELAIWILITAVLAFVAHRQGQDSSPLFFFGPTSTSSPGIETRPPGYWYRSTFRPDQPQPHARLAHAASSVDDENLYVFGGFYGFGNRSFGDLWRYHEPTDTWTELKPKSPDAEAPSPRLHHTMVGVTDAKTGRKYLIVYGGFNVFNTDPNHKALGDLYVYDIEAQTWSRMDAKMPKGAPQPTPRGAHEATWSNGRMYVSGGFEKIGPTGHSEEVWRYDLASNQWTNLTQKVTENRPHPEGRIGFAFHSIDHKAYLFGGGCESKGQCNDLWEFDTETEQWTELKPSGCIPSPRRSSHCEIAVFGILYLFGGVEINPGPDGKPVPKMLGDFHAYDPSANKWFDLHPDFDRGERPEPTFGHSVNVMGSRLVVFGGRVGAPTSPGTNQLWEYDVIPPRNSNHRNHKRYSYKLLF